jgi:hypothetical protein
MSTYKEIPAFTGNLPGFEDSAIRRRVIPSATCVRALAAFGSRWRTKYPPHSGRAAANDRREHIPYEGAAVDHAARSNHARDRERGCICST